MQAQLVEPEPAPPPAPRLVASESCPVGNVAAIMGKLMETAKGERFEIEDAYRAYYAAYIAQAKRAALFEDFVIALQRFCSAKRITMADGENAIYLLNRRLASFSPVNETA